MHDLAGVTLACVDTVNHALALRALDRSQRGLRFARTLFLTHAIPEGLRVPSGVAVEPIGRLDSRDDYSRFVLKSLIDHVTTPHVLLIQWDGYVVNPDAFDPAFLDCDYIGAKWYWFNDGMRVGNGGFSLRSHKLLDALRDDRITLAEAEDITIGRAFRPLLEREYAIRYASEALADRFAFEAAYPAGMPFGFHGLYNFCRVVPPAELAALAEGFSDAIARSIQLGQLIRNCIALGQWEPALALARRRLAVNPGDDETRTLLARAEAGAASGPVVGRNEPCPCGSGKRYKQCHGAIGAAPSRTAAQEMPRSPIALAREGLAAHERGDVDAAERAYRAALAREPEQPLALHYLGVALHQRGRHADALPMLERAITLVPGEPEFHNNLGLALAALDRNDDAIAAYRRALALKPAHATAWNNLGLAFQGANRLPEAIASFRRALELTPGFAHAHWNLALALLANGEYEEGWREYEWRLRLPELGGRAPTPAVPRWQGEDLRGKSLLVTAEQGIGDALQFIRFASDVATRGGRVIVQAKADLCALLATAPGVAATIATNEPLPPCDVEIPLLSLPHRFGVGAADLSVGGPYLHSDASRRDAIQRRFAHDDARAPRIGLAWAGAPHHRNDRRRSIALAKLAPLMAIPGLAWHSLQKGNAGGEIARVPQAHALVPLDRDSEFAHTAALVDALDAIVTVDTSIAHLAGALGKPIFVLLPFAPDWRWGIAGERTPWYASARLFRQSAVGDWGSAVLTLGDALRAMFPR